MPIRSLTPLIRNHTRVRRGCSSCNDDPNTIDKATIKQLQDNPALLEHMKDSELRQLLLERPTVAARMLHRKLPLSMLRRLRNGDLARLRRELMNPPAITLANGCRVQPRINLTITQGEENNDGNE